MTGKDQQTLVVVLVAAGCFVVACVTGLSALGRDATQVLYLLSAVVPATVGSIVAARNSRAAKDSANNAVDHAVDTSVAQSKLSAEVSQLRAQIGNRRTDDTGPNV